MAQIAPMLTESGNRCGACGARGTLVARVDASGVLMLTCQRCHSSYDFSKMDWPEKITIAPLALRLEKQRTSQ